MEFSRIRFKDSEAVIRSLEEKDIDRLVDYWHSNDAAFLEGIGADFSKLSSRDATREKFQRALEGKVGPGERAVMVVTLEDQVVGYFNLNFWTREEAAIHAHVLDERMRHTGLATTIASNVLATCFVNLGLQRVIVQTLPTNRASNGFLEKLGLVGRREYIEKPDGMARPGEFCVYEITPPIFQEIAMRAMARGA